jgi:hypothetical protein
MVESLHSPAFATSVGLLRWATMEHHRYQGRVASSGEWSKRFSGFFRMLLPG